MRCPALRLEHTTRHCDKKAQEPGRGGSTWPRSAPFFSWTTSTSRRSFRTNAPTPTCGSLAGVGASRASAQRRRRSAERAHGEHLVRGVGRQLVQVCGEPVRAHHVGRWNTKPAAIAGSRNAAFSMGTRSQMPRLPPWRHACGDAAHSRRARAAKRVQQLVGCLLTGWCKPGAPVASGAGAL